MERITLSDIDIALIKGTLGRISNLFYDEAIQRLTIREIDSSIDYSIDNLGYSHIAGTGIGVQHMKVKEMRIIMNSLLYKNRGKDILIKYTRFE